MCEFISWVQLPEGRIFYLTDAQVFSEIGRMRLAGIQDNDILGHGAIRRFYTDEGVGLGTDHELPYFWQDSARLPDELRPLLASWKTIDATWGRMLRQALTASDLVRLLWAPKEIAEGVWNIVLSRPQGRGEMLRAFLEQSGFSPFRERAFSLLASEPD